MVVYDSLRQAIWNVEESTGSNGMCSEDLGGLGESVVV